MTERSMETFHTTETCSPERAFWRPGMSLQVQSVLFNSDPAGIARAARSVARAADFACAGGHCTRVRMFYGDCSPMPCLTPEFLAELRQELSFELTIDYHHFGANLGSARGHNYLAEASGTDFILVLNPDVVMSPRTLETLLGCFRLPGVGFAEGKQLPIEHPKDYDRTTGETSWASTACAMTPMALFRQIGGFDADSFFLYCDDVDYSWMVRHAGFRVIHQPAAVVMHDKRLSDSGGWQASAAERYFSAEASLMMARKWSRPDLLQKYLDYFTASGDPDLTRAAATFRIREAKGTLPTPIDPELRTGQFIDTFYAKHRYSL